MSPFSAISTSCKTTVVDMSVGEGNYSAWCITSQCRCGWAGPRRARQWEAELDGQTHLNFSNL
ncbi:hypothetical protein [Nocardioides salsibiostraticola]